MIWPEDLSILEYSSNSLSSDTRRGVCVGVVESDLDRQVQEIDEMFLFTFVERLPYRILPDLAL